MSSSCGHCTKQADVVCSDCQTVAYCDQNCQRDHRHIHAVLCPTIASIRADMTESTAPHSSTHCKVARDSTLGQIVQTYRAFIPHEVHGADYVVPLPIVHSLSRHTLSVLTDSRIGMLVYDKLDKLNQAVSDKLKAETTLEAEQLELTARTLRDEIATIKKHNRQSRSLRELEDDTVRLYNLMHYSSPGAPRLTGEKYTLAYEEWQENRQLLINAWSTQIRSDPPLLYDTLLYEPEPNVDIHTPKAIPSASSSSTTTTTLSALSMSTKRTKQDDDDDDDDDKTLKRPARDYLSYLTVLSTDTLMEILSFSSTRYDPTPYAPQALINGLYRARGNDVRDLNVQYTIVNLLKRMDREYHAHEKTNMLRLWTDHEISVFHIAVCINHMFLVMQALDNMKDHRFREIKFRYESYLQRTPEQRDTVLNAVRALYLGNITEDPTFTPWLIKSVLRWNVSSVVVYLMRDPIHRPLFVRYLCDGSGYGLLCDMTLLNLLSSDRDPTRTAMLAAILELSSPSLVTTTDRNFWRIFLRKQVLIDRWESVALLVRYGVDPTFLEDGPRPVLGYTALDYACRLNDVSMQNRVVRFLLQHGANPNHSENILHTYLQIHPGDKSNTINLLLDHGLDVSGSGPLFTVCKSKANLLDKAQLLVSRGANIKVLNSDGQNALYPAIRSHRISIVTWLLDQGLDINHRDIGGRTPLFELASSPFVDMLDLLLDKGANVNLARDDGSTAIHHFIGFTMANGFDFWDIVSPHIIDINQSDKDGNTFLHLALNKRDIYIVQKLLAHPDIDTLGTFSGFNRSGTACDRTVLDIIKDRPTTFKQGPWIPVVAELKRIHRIQALAATRQRNAAIKK